ncbi:MAG TPA: hypothetical protein VFE16_12365 [Candidatus Cybelea sp.]|jgi:hypothetical protein|nr:hypothetical protein [Candidatus Cybelea sp.]
MKGFAASLALVMAVSAVVLLPMPAHADATQIEGVTVTSADITQLLTALHTALKPNDSTIPVIVSLKASSGMPSYDPQWHYVGIQEQSSGVKAMIIWINADLKGTDLQNTIASSFLLALADGGYGGTAFKQLYDIYAAKDAELPPNAPDPYLNRHKFAAALAKMVQSPN